MVVIDATGVRSRSATPSRARSSACSSSSTSPGPTRSSTARACTPPASAWARSSPARRRCDGRHGHAGPRVGHPRRAGLRARVGHPVRRRAREEPLRRPHVHPAEPEATRRRRAAQAQPAAREHQGQAPRRRRRLDRAGHHALAQTIAMLREAGAAEVHFRVSSPPYRWPCFYGMDTGRRSDLLAADMSVGEISRLPRRRLARLPRSRPPRRRHRRAAARRSAPRASPASTRCRCPSTTRSSCSRPRRATSVAIEPTPVTVRRDRRPERSHGAADDRNRSTYADAGVDIAAGEKAVELIKEHVRSTFRPEVVGDIGGFGGLFALDGKRYHDPLLVVVDRRRRHEVADRPADGPLRHDRHRLRRDVGRRHRRARRRAAVLPRLHLGRQARARGDRRDRRRASPRVAARPAARCSAARCRSIPASWSRASSTSSGFAVGVVERAESCRAACSRATGSSASRAPACAATATRSRARRCSIAPAATSTGAAWRGRAPLARRRAAAAERDLRAGDARAAPPRRGARVRARHRRRHPRQPRAGAPDRLRRGRPARRLGGTADLRRDPARRATSTDDEMEHVFNLGLGMLAVVPRDEVNRALDAVRAAGHEAWRSGEIVDGHGRVTMTSYRCRGQMTSPSVMAHLARTCYPRCIGRALLSAGRIGHIVSDRGLSGATTG